MKKHILSLAMILALLLSACGTAAQSEDLSGESAEAAASDPVSEEPAESEAVETGTVSNDAGSSFTLAYDPDSALDPYTCTSSANQVICSLLFEGLFTTLSDFTWQNTLCSGTSVSEDGLIWTLTLRADTRFSNGDPLTASDVAASLEAAEEGLYAGRLDLVESIDILSDQQISITLSKPCDTLPLLLDIPISSGGAGVYGTGPYYLADALTLARSESCCSGCAIEAQQIRLSDVVTSVDIRDSFERGDITAVCTDPSSPSAVSYRTDYELWTIPTTTMLYIGFNLNSSTWGSLEYRSCITWGIDRTWLVQEVYGGFGQAASLPCMPWSQYYDNVLASQYDYDETQFRNILDSMDLPEDTMLSGTMIVRSNNTQRLAAARKIVEQLNALGLNITLSALNDSDFEEAISSGSYDLYLGEITLAPNGDLTPLFDGSLDGGYNSTSVCALCDQALENRGNNYSLDKAICEQAYLVPVLFKTRALYMTRDAITSTSCAPGHPFYLQS